MTTPGPESPSGKSRREAFEVYVSLGPSRTYRQVAERLGVSLATVKRYAKAHSWLSQIEEREAQIARHAADRAIESAAEDIERKRKLVKAALIRLGQAIAQGKIKMQLADLDRLIRLDGMLHGRPEGGLGSRAAGAMTAEELEAYIDMTPTDVLDDFLARLAARAGSQEAPPGAVSFHETAVSSAPRPGRCRQPMVPQRLAPEPVVLIPPSHDTG